MKKEKLHIGDSVYTYYRYGYGAGLLIALHGYGESGLVFKGLEGIWADRYTIIAPDLPFHGATQLAKADFDASDMDVLLQRICERFEGRSLALMGHSFGGRVLLYLLPEWAERVDRYFLLSPDGLATPGMRWSLRLPIALQRGIQQVLSGWSLQPLFKALHRLGWLSFHQQYFLSYHLGDRERRTRLFAYWRSLGHFTLHKPKLKQRLASHQVPTHIYLGEKDQVISPKAIAKIVEPYANIEVNYLDAGHRLFGPKLYELLKQQ